MTELAQARQSSMRHSTGRRGGFRSSSAGKFSMMEGHSMSIPGFAIMPELPPVSELPQMPLRVPGDHSETMSGDVDRVTAELNISRAYAREEEATAESRFSRASWAEAPLCGVCSVRSRLWRRPIPVY